MDIGIGDAGASTTARHVRTAAPEDLTAILELYLHLNPAMPPLSDGAAQRIWADILSRRGTWVFVAALGPQLVATCMLVTAPNLMKGGRPHGLVENVVTHRDFRRQGHGRAVVTAALEAAWREHCHGVMLLTGRKDAAVLRFYESCGFETGLKAGLLARAPGRS